MKCLNGSVSRHTAGVKPFAYLLAPDFPGASITREQDLWRAVAAVYRATVRALSPLLRRGPLPPALERFVSKRIYDAALEVHQAHGRVANLEAGRASGGAA